MSELLLRLWLRKPGRGRAKCCPWVQPGGASAAHSEPFLSQWAVELGPCPLLQSQQAPRRRPGLLVSSCGLWADGGLEMQQEALLKNSGHLLPLIP